MLVYLDSQDFSRFSSSSADFAAFADIRHELLELKRDGVCQFAFSDVHILEAFPAPGAPIAPGLERIRTIAEFCGRQHLPSAMELIEREIQHLVDRVGNTSVAQRRPPVDWFPAVDFDIPVVCMSDVVDKVLPGISANRSMRRTLDKLAAPKAKHIQREKAAEGARELARTYPFLAHDFPLLVSYFRGQQRRGAVIEAIKNGLRNITALADWFAKNPGPGTAFMGVLRASGADFSASLVRFYTNSRANFEHHSDKITKAEMSRLIDDVMRDQRISMRRQIARRLVQKRLGEDRTIPENVEIDRMFTPILYLLYDFIFSVFEKSGTVDLPRNPLKKNTSSDFVDGMHLTFVPRVDLMRVDRFTASIARAIYARPGFEFVDDIRLLPGLIRARWTGHPSQESQS